MGRRGFAHQARGHSTLKGTIVHFNARVVQNARSDRSSQHGGIALTVFYPLLEQTSTHNELLYVGPRQKEQFLAYLSRRLRDKRLDGLVKNLFRPSYGGNRNHTLMYTLGGLMVSSDDDMRPYELMEHSIESLGDGEVSRGRLHRAGHNG